MSRPAKSISVEQQNTIFLVEDVIELLSTTLQLDENASALTEESPILGAMPEFDSVAVVTVIAALEERFGLVVDDDEISADIFQTVGTLSRFVDQKRR